MDGTEFVYLAVGLGVGVASNRLLRRFKAEPAVNVGQSFNQPHQSPPIKPLPKVSVDQTQQQEQFRIVSKQLQQTQLAYQMASEMCQFKAGFLARTSHELRSPINSIIGTIQLILADLCETPEEEREFLQQAYESALKMIAILDEVIQVAKIDHGTEILKLQPLQLAEVFEDLKKLTYLQAANRSIRLHIDTPDPNIYVMADPSRLQQVLVSLVDNAIAQMEQGKVQVSIHPDPKLKYINIWIDDQRPISAWSESWELIQSTLSANQEYNTPVKTDHLVEADIKLSPGMRLLLNQTLLGSMNGKLEILAVPTETELSQFTRTQCSVPLAPSPPK
ncbi:MAG: sensor histidine kinase [Microcoleaceae cyanobacterium]